MQKAGLKPKWNFRDYLKALKTENFDFGMLDILTFGTLFTQFEQFFVYV